MEKDSRGMIRVATIFLTLFGIQTVGLCQEPLIEIQHGTVMIYEETPSQVIVVTESKLFPGPEKIACKINQLSQDTLFFYTGHLFKGFDVRNGRELFTQQKIARQAFETVKGQTRSEQRLLNVANKYAELIRPKMEQLFETASKYDFSEHVGLAVFGSTDEFDKPRIVTVHVPVVKTAESGRNVFHAGVLTLREPIPNQEQMGDYPQYTGAIEFLDKKTPRSKQANKRFESQVQKYPKTDHEVHRLIAAVQASLDWNIHDDYIGPPINAAVIEPGTGVRWIQGKDRCGLKAISLVTPR